MPLLPPVTTATLPSSFAIFFSLVFRQSMNGINSGLIGSDVSYSKGMQIFLTDRSTITPKEVYGYGGAQYYKNWPAARFQRGGRPGSGDARLLGEELRRSNDVRFDESHGHQSFQYVRGLWGQRNSLSAGH